MAKKQNGSAKKSAIPYTPEVVPQAQQQAEASTMKPTTSPAGAKSVGKPAAKPGMAPVMAEVPPIARPAAAANASNTAAAKPAVDPVTLAGAVAAAPKTITYDMIAQRAYFIALSGTGGSEDDNWHRAEAELKREAESA